jgi:hypothetical protein
MGQAQQKRRAVLIVEDDAELRGLTVALLEDGGLDTIECESAEAALATMLIRGQRHRHDFRRHSTARRDGRGRSGARGQDALAAPHRGPTSEDPRERVGALPPGVAYMVKPWQPLNLLVTAEEALASASG